MPEPTITLSDLKAAMQSDCCLPASEPALHALIAKHEPKPESLFGRWATHPKHGRVIIIDGKDVFGKSMVVFLKNGRGFFKAVDWVELVLDPITLTTEQDYQNAPTGTIIEDEYDAVHVKSDITWFCTDGEEYSSRRMAGITSRVVRWGDGK